MCSLIMGSMQDENGEANGTGSIEKLRMSF